MSQQSREAKAPVHLAISIRRPSEKRSSSRTATRTLDVLEFFGASRKALRAVDLLRALELTPSTTNQLLKTMVDSGHLVFDARNKTYLPSPRLAQFGGWIADRYGPDPNFRELMRTLRDELGLVVTLSTPNDVFMQILDSVIPEGTSAERGLRISLFGSAIGNACLSMMDDADIDRLAYRARVADQDLARIMTELAHIRHTGFAKASSINGTVQSIGIPLHVRGLPAPAVLGLAGPMAEIADQVSAIVIRVRSAMARFGIVSQSAEET